MAISMDQVHAMHGMGNYAAAIAAIVGPVAGAGADAYRTYADSQQNRKELKQRQRELQAMLPIYQQQQKQRALETVAAVRQQQIVSSQQAAATPYMVQAIALGALALVAIAVARRG